SSISVAGQRLNFPTPSGFSGIVSALAVIGMANPNYSARSIGNVADHRTPVRISRRAPGILTVRASEKAGKKRSGFRMTGPFLGPKRLMLNECQPFSIL
ncbi:MAG: hypothetical protein AAB519_00550, partial [Patescibacteria group bacterium]